MFETANAAYAFTSIPSPRHDEPWEGTVNESGRLRLVATGPGVFQVAVLHLRSDPNKN